MRNSKIKIKEILILLKYFRIDDFADPPCFATWKGSVFVITAFRVWIEKPYKKWFYRMCLYRYTKVPQSADHWQKLYQVCYAIWQTFLHNMKYFKHLIGYSCVLARSADRMLHKLFIFKWILLYNIPFLWMTFLIVA